MLRGVYLTNKANGHNKHYFVACVTAPGGGVDVMTAWGRIGVVPSEKRVVSLMLADADARLHQMVNDKVKHGYHVEWATHSRPLNTKWATHAVKNGLRWPVWFDDNLGKTAAAKQQKGKSPSGGPLAAPPLSALADALTEVISGAQKRKKKAVKKAPAKKEKIFRKNADWNF